MESRYSIKNFLPLIFIFFTILLFCFVRQLYTPGMHTFMYDFMGAFFIVFGCFKAANLRGFVSAYTMYDLLAQKSTVYAYAYPFIEVVLGVLYLARWYLVFTNIVTICIMLVGIVSVLRALRVHEQIMCACLGVVFKIPMTYVTLLEDVIMFVMAVWMLVVDKLI